MKNSKHIFMILCLVLVAAVSVKPAMAYFTDATEASGMVSLSISNPDTDSDESETEKGTMIKKIRIKNTGSTEEFVRVRALCGSNYTVTTYEGTASAWKLSEDGSYFEYQLPLAPSESTEALVLKIGVIDSTITNDFNVIIVQEATAACYDESGKAYADWTKQIFTSEEEGQVDEEAN